MNLYHNLPIELRESGKFNCWKYVKNPDPNKKPKKVPYNVLTGGKGKSTDPATFTDFHTALAAVGNYDGLGIGVFDDLVVIDLDNCVKDRVITSEAAQNIADEMDAYTEISPSGTGLRIIAKATGFVFDKLLYYINNQKLGVEVYIAGFTAKFLTVTGDVIRKSELVERGEQLDTVLVKYMLRPRAANALPEPGESVSFLTDESVIKKGSSG